MRKLILGLAALALLNVQPAEASVGGKVKAVALFPIRLVKYTVIGLAAGATVATVKSLAQWYRD